MLEKNIAAFIDKDGVICELSEYEEGDKVAFTIKKEEIKLIKNSAKAIKKLNEKDIKVIIITNQPQIGRGLITEEEGRELNNQTIKLLEENEARVDAVYYCPHHPTKGLGKYKINCECRKPKPGMILRASKEHNINLENSYVIGDRTADIKAGKLAGCKKAIGVKTGYACDDDFKDAVPDVMADDLSEAVNIILGEIK